MAEMTDASWAAAVASQAATDGCDAGQLPSGAPSHYRQASTVRNRLGVVVLQSVIDIRTGGFTGETNGTDNTL